MQLSTRQARRIFLKLEVEKKESKHHIAGFVMLNGTRLLPIHFSHGKKDLPGHVPEKFRKSLRLSRDEFETLKSCRMTKEEYFSKQRDNLYDKRRD